jgi:hypothetical protein
MTSDAELASQRIAPSQPLVNNTNLTAVIQPDLVNSNHPANFFVGNLHISPKDSLQHPLSLSVHAQNPLVSVIICLIIIIIIIVIIYFFNFIIIIIVIICLIVFIIIIFIIL